MLQLIYVLYITHVTKHGARAGFGFVYIIPNSINYPLRMITVVMLAKGYSLFMFIFYCNYIPSTVEVIVYLFFLPFL